MPPGSMRDSSGHPTAENRDSAQRSAERSSTDTHRFADSSRGSNRVTVRFRYPLSMALLDHEARARISTRFDFERELVAAIQAGDKRLGRALGGPTGAQFLTAGTRLTDNQRANYADNHPRQRLEEYIVLAYPAVKEARTAVTQLAASPAVLSASLNQSMQASATRNDPYFNLLNQFGPVPTTVAGTYQWGLHAMNFPAAWDITGGHGYVGALEVGFVNGIAHADLVRNFRPQMSYDGGQWPVTISEFQPSSGTGFPYPFHASHVLGIIGATANNGHGIAGACEDCSLIVSNPFRYRCKVERDQSYPYPERTVCGYFAAHEVDNGQAAALVAMIDAGVQIVNISHNESPSAILPAKDNTASCEVGDWDLETCEKVLDGNGDEDFPSERPGTQTVPRDMIDALELAHLRDVLTVVSSGNFSQQRPAWPASSPFVLAVAGAQPTNALDPHAWSIWLTSQLNSASGTNEGSNGAGVEGVVAPAKHIVSTVPIAFRYSDSAEFDCSDTAPTSAATLGDLSGIFGDGYGTCTGTSMAAPHVSALGGILRSANPLLSADDIKDVIRNSGSHAANPNATVGHGMPNAAVAVASVVPGPTKNRLTPLFSLYSHNRQDYFFTTVPQMATAALRGTLRPRSSATWNAEMQDYTSAGLVEVTGYPHFPDPPFPELGKSVVPTADAWVFTTANNPANPAIKLAPLYRLSRRCEDMAQAGRPATCTSYPNHTDTTYTTEQAGIDSYVALGYKLDGIEGYIYPKSMSSQPSGTERLMRKYHPVRDDHAIFPESRLSEMTQLGYTQNSGSDWLGYVYPNINGVPPSVEADSQPPSIPTALSATATGASQISLGWAASTDNVSVVAYKVYRGGVLLASIGNTTNYVDSGLASFTMYSYSVSACDASGNCSPQSSMASATTLDGTAPTVPSGFTAIASSGSQVDLAWSASTDNVGVTAYKVYRNGAVSATIGAVTNYSVTGLIPNTTQSFAVAACDGAANCSAMSSSVSVTLPANSPASDPGMFTGFWIPPGASNYVVADQSGISGAAQTFLPGCLNQLVPDPYNTSGCNVASYRSGSLSGGGNIIVRLEDNKTIAVRFRSKSSLTADFNRTFKVERRDGGNVPYPSATVWLSAQPGEGPAAVPAACKSTSAAKPTIITHPTAVGKCNIVPDTLYYLNVRPDGACTLSGGGATCNLRILKNVDFQ